MSRPAASAPGKDQLIDVLVCGGGPAGTALAVALAARGRAVLVLERSRYEAPRVGEHLPPGAQPLLEQLGAWERFRNGPHIPSPGVRAQWGGEAFRERDYLFNAYGQGWNIDRAAFDAMLADAATEAGAHVVVGTRVASIERRGDKWHARLSGGPRDGAEVAARVLVDATGRAASLARRFGSMRRSRDRLVGLCGWLTRKPRDDDNHRLVVEAAERGWWYATLLPANRCVAVFLSDSDLVPAGTGPASELWREELTHTRTIASVLDANGAPACFRLRAANSYILDRIGGDGWLAVGDAASAFDPLSSMGILKALRGAIDAAAIIARHLTGDDEALPGYARGVEGEFARYLNDRNEVYADERRWPDAPFWRRRAAEAHRR